MSAIPAASIAALDGTLGSIEIGGIVGTFLFGIITLQVHNYYRTYPADSIPLKLLVAVIWFLELGHTISTWHAIFTLSITFYGQPDHISDPPHSLQMTLMFSAPIYAVVQVFFANRVRIVSGHCNIMLLCCFLSLLRFACSMGMLVVTLQHGLAILQIKYRWLMAAGLSLGATVDVIIAVSMCCCLWQLRRSMFQRSRRMADMIMAWSIETGCATSGTSLIQLFLFLTRSDLVWFPFFLVTARLFSNSLLVSLNSRHTLRSLNQDEPFLDVGTLRRSGMTASAALRTSSVKRPLNIAMSVAIQTDGDRDYDSSFLHSID
ncbi:Saposin B-type domain-containing protein [Mycena venus]|uniref:Saposin B-type domain-containing protein n=1 Tax=Mycena venus TaxID=2733690 RepID=A0A8H6YXR9_9AGAR|nr:Saposin B-type domain-containing protein [Mycena venus]